MRTVALFVALVAAAVAAAAAAAGPHARPSASTPRADPTPSTDEPYALVELTALQAPTQDVSLSLRYDPTIKDSPRYLDAFVQGDGNNRKLLTVENPATSPTFPMDVMTITPPDQWTRGEFDSSMRTVAEVHSLTTDDLFYTLNHVFQWSGQGTALVALNTDPFSVEFIVASTTTADMVYAFEANSDSTGVARRLTITPGTAPAWHGTGLTIPRPRAAVEFNDLVVIGGTSSGHQIAVFVDAQAWTHDSTLDVEFGKPGESIVSMVVETANPNFAQGACLVTWNDGAVAVIDMSTKKEVPTNFKVPLVDDERIRGAAFDNTNNYMFYGTSSGRVYKVNLSGYTPVFSIALDTKYAMSIDPVFDLDGTIYFGVSSDELAPTIAVIHSLNFCPNDCPDQDCNQGKCVPLPTLSPLPELVHPGNPSAIAGLVVMSFVLCLVGATALLYTVWRTGKSGFAPNIA